MGLDFMCGLTSCRKLLKATEEVANFDTCPGDFRL